MSFLYPISDAGKHSRSNSLIRSDGRGYIAGEGAGLVTKAGVPARARVVLCLKGPSLSLYRIAEQWSAADGTYRFDQLDESRKYAVLAFDETGEFDAVIRDNITPASMDA